MATYDCRLLKDLKVGNIELMRDKRGRVFFWDNLKFLLITFVVLGHFADVYSYSSLRMRELFLFIYTFHMPLFIFVSAYFSKTVIDSKQFKIEKVLSYLLLYFLLKVCIYIQGRYSFSGINTNFNLFTEVGIPWYLFAMSVWLCLTYIIKNIKPLFVIICSIVIGVLVGYDKTVGDFLCLSRILVFFPFFTLGYYFNENNIIKVLKCNWLKWLSLISTTIIILVIFKYGQDVYRFRGFFTARNSYIALNEPLYGGLYRLLFYGLTTIISLAIIYITPKGRIFVSMLGSRTLQIYFIHSLILAAYQHYKLNNYLVKLFPHSWKIVYLCIAVVLTFILSLKIFEIPFKKVMDIKLKAILRE